MMPRFCFFVNSETRGAESTLLYEHFRICGIRASVVRETRPRGVRTAASRAYRAQKNHASLGNNDPLARVHAA